MGGDVGVGVDVVGGGAGAGVGGSVASKSTSGDFFSFREHDKKIEPRK